MQDMIATPGHSWRQMEEELRLMHDLIGGTAMMRRAGARWLPREAGESWGAWRARLNRSVLFNGVGRLVQVLSGTPFRQDVSLQDADKAIIAPLHHSLSAIMRGCARILMLIRLAR